jgi:pyruvate/2-oxoacid:ferredoxin oxidoreductase alpha subunit
MKELKMGTEAAAIAVRLAKAQVISAYPITPQTVLVEELSDIVGKEELKAKYITVESEHSAMASCIGASLAGARTFTATSSQGLAYMHEVLHYAAGMRLPIVMVNANRALAPPWNLYCDHTDSLAQRDTGWMQYYCDNVQNVLDSILIAYRVAEQAQLPVMINMDAFYLTHTSEQIDIPDQDEVDRFLKPFRPVSKLDVDNPKTFGNVCGSDLYMAIKFKRHQDMLNQERLWEKAAVEYNKCFKRFCPPVEAYRTQDADLVLIGIGTLAGTLRLAVERLRENGIAAGSIRLAMMRPFPVNGLHSALTHARHVVVIDRDVSFGAEGILAQEVKANLFGCNDQLKIDGFVAGIGGRDITTESVVDIARQAISGNGPAKRAGSSLWAEVLA